MPSPLIVEVTNSESNIVKIIAALAASMTIILPASAQTIDPKVAANLIAMQTLAKPLALTTYTWSHNDQAPTLLPPVATHYCVLTGFTGKLAGDGELAQLFIDSAAQGGPRFMLGGKTQQLEFKVTATCAAKDQFVQQMSKLPLTETIHPLVSASGCGAKTLPNGSGAAAAGFLAAIGGRFAGDGENVAATNQGKNSVTLIAACSGTVSAATLTIGGLFATPVYRTPTGTSIDPASSTTTAFFKVKDPSGLAVIFSEAKITYADNQYLSPVNDALCGIVGIQGKFNGYGEYVQVAPTMLNGQTSWQVLAFPSYEASNPTVAVSVRCLARDQRNK